MLEWDLSDGVLYLAGGLKIAEAAELAESLEQLVFDQSPLTLDLSQIDEADTAGLQILLSFCRTRAENTQTRIVNPSACFQKAASLTGLEAHFQSYLA